MLPYEKIKPINSMDYANMLSLLSSRRNWLLFLLAFMFGRITTSQNQPNTGLFCISDCVTCPVICSPPPSPSKKSSSPPPPQLPKLPPPTPPQLPKLPPPQLPKSPPIHQSPPRFYYFTSPPSHPPPTVSPPAPIYVTVPSTGPQNNTRPYYYVYASKATFVSQYSSVVLIVVFSVLLVNGRSS